MMARERTDRWWLVVTLAKFAMEYLQQGLLKAMSVLLPSMVVYFNTDYTTMGFILSLEYTVYYLASPITRILSKRFNPRLLATAGGIGTGVSLICTCLATTPLTLGLCFFFTGLFGSAVCQTAYVTLRQHCKDQFATANTVSFLGAIFGGITLPLLTAQLQLAFGFRGTLLCIGGLFLHYIPIGLVLKPPSARLEKRVKRRARYSSRDDMITAPEEVADHEMAKESTTFPNKMVHFFYETLDIRVLCNERVVFFTLVPVKILLEAVYVGWALFQVSYARSVGIDDDLAVYLPVSGACAGFISRALSAIVFHYRLIWAFPMFVSMQVLIILTLFVFPLSSNFSYLIGCSFAAGFGILGISTAYYAVLSVAVREENFPGIVSVILFVTGLGAIIAGVLPSKIYDITGSFETAFRVLGGFMIVVLALTLLFHLLSRRSRSQQPDEP